MSSSRWRSTAASMGSSERIRHHSHQQRRSTHIPLSFYTAFSDTIPTAQSSKQAARVFHCKQTDYTIANVQTCKLMASCYFILPTYPLTRCCLRK